MPALRIYWLLGAVLIITSSTPAGELDLQLESGNVWFSRNEVRIPGDDGTKFDLRDLTGDPYVRFYATYDFMPSAKRLFNSSWVTAARSRTASRSST